MEDIKKIFPTEELYCEFLLFQAMNDKQREAFAEENSNRFHALSKEDQEREIETICVGVAKAVEFADRSFPLLTKT